MDILQSFYEQIVYCEGAPKYEQLEQWQIDNLKESRAFAGYKLRFACDRFQESMKREVQALGQQIKRLFKKT